MSSSGAASRATGLPRPENQAAVVALTVIALTGFAANSLLCRMALRGGAIDPASFTAVRLVSGALVLNFLLLLRGGYRSGGDWKSGVVLFVYAAAFSIAYVSIPAGAGALLLFGSVQTTMIVRGLVQGEHPRWYEWCGLALACAGLIALISPGLSAPPLGSGLIMMAAGIAWGVYSLRGRSSRDAVAGSAGNFLRALPFALPFLLWVQLRPGQAGAPGLHFDTAGLVEAILSGTLASGLGYAVWYTVLPALTAMRAAVVQLAVPVLVAAAGVTFLGEQASLRLIGCGALTLGGVALATCYPLYLKLYRKPQQRH
jgi:drug/metabolite transporter (DMT)-like permease